MLLRPRRRLLSRRGRRLLYSGVDEKAHLCAGVASRAAPKLVLAVENTLVAVPNRLIEDRIEEGVVIV